MPSPSDPPSDQGRAREARSIPALTRAMAGGDNTAWTEFHHRYFDRIFRYLLVVHRGDEDAARESVQCVFLRIVRHVRQFPDEDVLWSWITCVARCTATDQHRGRNRYRRLLERFAHWRESRSRELLPGPRYGAVEPVLEECLERFPPTDRAMIEKRYFERWTNAELAEEFGLTERAVESRLARLRKRLRSCLESSLQRPSPAPFF